MHPLHDYIAKLLGDRLNARKIVVWYDQRGEFAPFINEVRGGPRTSPEPVLVSVGEVAARVLEYAGSIFEVRTEAEPYASGDTPDAVVLYLPGCVRDAGGSVLMELEEAGTRWNPVLVQLARNLLLKTYTLGVVDQMLPGRPEAGVRGSGADRRGQRTAATVDPEDHLSKCPGQRRDAGCLAGGRIP